MNVFLDFVPNKSLTFSDRNSPWMTVNIKDKIHYCNNISRENLKNGRQQVGYIKLQNTVKK